MDEYKGPYLILWKGIADALEQIDGGNFLKIRNTLVEAQQMAENEFICEK